MLIDPDEGWLYGFPKKAPKDWMKPEFDLEAWLVSEGYPANKEPLYVRYIEEKEDNT